ncbi:hypothetical protein ACJIZ3_008854 [Penstemon smallii]|uniref:Uncharacterized protein n=1 Tax=Penstemon smallii TaxID=265156 RepID=A0ABD3RI14_9LAMI
MPPFHFKPVSAKKRRPDKRNAGAGTTTKERSPPASQSAGQSSGTTLPGEEASFVTELLQTSVKERFKQSVRQQATEINRIDVFFFCFSFWFFSCLLRLLDDLYRDLLPLPRPNPTVVS